MSNKSPRLKTKVHVGRNFRMLDKNLTALVFTTLFLGACGSSGVSETPLIDDTENTVDDNLLSEQSILTTDDSKTDPVSAVELPEVPVPDSNTPFPEDPTDIRPISNIYTEDGYEDVNVIRIDAKIVESNGECVESDYTGCTFADVLADINHKDNYKPEVQIRFTGTDFPDDGMFTNASLRQRGGSTRKAEQKSFRIKLDDKDALWRGERRLLLNKHPYEATRIRNKLAFDLMSTVPNLRSMRTQFVNLWIDKGEGPEDYGLFTHIEAASKEYLQLRDLNTDDNLYKANYFAFKKSALNTLKVDADGDPINKELFEQSLEIKSGKDHSMLTEMLTAFHDPSIPFDDFLDKHFNRNNVLTWLALNILMHQSDAVTHNFIMYNPEGSEKFYFLPWDYDGAMVGESEPTNSLVQKDLQRRLFYGYARGINNQFITRFYQQPNMHSQIVAAAEELRRDYLTDDAIDSRARRYTEIVEPFANRAPDFEFNSGYNIYASQSMSRAIEHNLNLLRNEYGVPMPPTVLPPTLEGDEWKFSWSPAFDVTGGDIAYELILSSSINFEPDSIVYNQPLSDNELANNDNSVIETYVSDSFLPDGDWYVRVIARSDKNPSMYWQVNKNVIYADNTGYYGVLHFNTADSQMQ